MSERRSRPRGGVMARCTSGWKRGSHVIGIADARVIGLVTRIAVRRSAGVTAADVTVGASDTHVCSRQREARFCVIEGRRHPG